MTVERPAAEGARRLRDQRRAPAGQEGRHEPARLRRRWSSERLERDRRHRRASRSPARASSTSPSRPAPRASVAAADRRRRARRTAPPTRSPGEKINLEFVSANPTGPIHIGGVRWAAVGDALGRIFTMTGAEVTREYYFNDHGAQIDRFSRSLLASAQGEPAPEDGYGGDYIHEIAAAVVAQRPEVSDLADDEAQEVFRAERRRDDVRRRSSRACTTSASTSTSTSTRTTCTRAVRSTGPSRGSPSSATPTSRTARSGCAPRSSATTRTG